MQPWRTRNDVWSPMSFVFGILLIGLAILAITGIQPWFGWLVVGLLGLAVVVALVVQIARGHRRWCLTRRAFWYGLSAPGAPVRFVISLGF